MFLSHRARLQRKLIDAGVENQLVVYEGRWHVFQECPIPKADVGIDNNSYDLGGYDDFGGYHGTYDVDPGDFGGGGFGDDENLE
jgi:hypothetical protein